MSVPGTIGSVVVERPADVEEGFHLNAPLVFHYGHTAPSTNPQLYKLLVSRMAEVTNLKCDKQRKGQVKASLSIITKNPKGHSLFTSPKVGI